jgi:hypothetical protein
MLKIQNVSNLNYTKDKSIVDLFVGNESSLPDIKDALNQFLAYIINFEQAQIKAKEQADAEAAAKIAPIPDVSAEPIAEAVSA